MNEKDSPAKPSAPKRRYDRESREAALIKAAVKVFARRGYEAATTREIAAKAGCAEGLIHRYFNGKQGLLMAAVRQGASETRSKLTQMAPEAGSWEQLLTTLFDAQLERFWSKRDAMRVTVAQGIIDRKMGKQLSSQAHQALSEGIEKRLREFDRARGKRLDDQTVQALAVMVDSLSFTLGFFWQVVFERTPEEARREARRMSELLARALPSKPE